MLKNKKIIKIVLVTMCLSCFLFTTNARADDEVIAEYTDEELQKVLENENEEINNHVPNSGQFLGVDENGELIPIDSSDIKIDVSSLNQDNPNTTTQTTIEDKNKDKNENPNNTETTNEDKIVEFEEDVSIQESNKNNNSNITTTTEPKVVDLDKPIEKPATPIQENTKSPFIPIVIIGVFIVGFIIAFIAYKKKMR